MITLFVDFEIDFPIDDAVSFMFPFQRFETNLVALERAIVPAPNATKPKPIPCAPGIAVVTTPAFIIVLPRLSVASAIAKVLSAPDASLLNTSTAFAVLNPVSKAENPAPTAAAATLSFDKAPTDAGGGVFLEDEAMSLNVSEVFIMSRLVL